MTNEPKCIECSIEMSGSQIHRRYCSGRCKARWRKKNPSPDRSEGHDCRMCGDHFQIQSGQHNKWLCSDACRRASNTKSVRTFHERRPLMDGVYRARTKAKVLPDGNLVRFYRSNPEAPKSCQSCGESRVLDVAHRPEYPRLGAWRSSKNCMWPEMVWILCPRCHALLDRMHYPPSELGLV